MSLLSTTRHDAHDLVVEVSPERLVADAGRPQQLRAEHGAARHDEVVGFDRPLGQRVEVLHVSTHDPAARALESRHEVLGQDGEAAGELRIGEQRPEHRVDPGPVHVLALAAEPGPPLRGDGQVLDRIVRRDGIRIARGELREVIGQRLLDDAVAVEVELVGVGVEVELGDAVEVVPLLRRDERRALERGVLAGSRRGPVGEHAADGVASLPRWRGCASGPVSGCGS